MSFIVKPSEEFWNLKSNDQGIFYLPLKKVQFSRIGDEIFLYKDGEHAGIFGEGLIMGNPTKFSLVLEEDQHLITRRSYFQLPVLRRSFHHKSYLSDKYVKHLPSLNTETKIKLGRFDKLYLAWGISHDLTQLGLYNDIQDSEEKYFLYKFHILREKYFRENRTWIKNEAFTGKNTCSKCGIKGPERKKHEPYFFEFHETIPVDFSGEHQKINPDNFVVLCGNCHKLVHSEEYFDIKIEPKPEYNLGEWSGWFPDFDGRVREDLANDSGVNISFGVDENGKFDVNIKDSK